jgi:2-dehydropantoate 2-reductase
VLDDREHGMKIAVVGCGAMGSIYAGLLASAGNTVCVVDGWQAHVDAINARRAAGRRRQWRPRVRLAAHLQAPAQAMDLVIIAAKAAQVGAAAQAARADAGVADAGAHAAERPGQRRPGGRSWGPERLLVGIAAAFGASLRGPGHSHHEGMAACASAPTARWTAGPRRGGGRAVARCRLHAQAVTQVRAMQWEKLICNVAYSGPCALAGMTVGQVMDDPELGPVSRAAARGGLGDRPGARCGAAGGQRPDRPCPRLRRARLRMPGPRCCRTSSAAGAARSA